MIFFNSEMLFAIVKLCLMSSGFFMHSLLKYVTVIQSTLAFLHDKVSLYESPTYAISSLLNPYYSINSFNNSHLTSPKVDPV